MATGKINFGTTVHAVARENGMSLAEVGKASGTVESQITKWKRGKWQVIPEERLSAVLDAVCKTPEQRKSCLMAYAFDMIPDRERPLIMFGDRLDPKAATASVNADLNLKFKAIAVALKRSEDFKRMFETVAGWAKRIAAE